MAAKRWFVIYTKPRWEKKVHERLTERGFECYCPLNKVHRKWSDRIKIVEEPLFKSYLFISIPEADQSKVRLINGVINYVYWLGKPAQVKAAEIARIKRFLSEHTDVELEPISVAANDQVLITSGALMEKKGRVLKAYGNKVMVEIESLGYKLVANLEKKHLIKIHN